jgi:hypothetical protein
MYKHDNVPIAKPIILMKAVSLVSYQVSKGAFEIAFEHKLSYWQ